MITDRDLARAEAEYLRRAEERFEPCEPRIIRAEKEYEPDGYSTNYIYNCDECDNTECEWYNER